MIVVLFCLRRRFSFSFFLLNLILFGFSRMVSNRGLNSEEESLSSSEVEIVLDDEIRVSVSSSSSISSNDSLLNKPLSVDEVLVRRRVSVVDFDLFLFLRRRRRFGKVEPSSYE